MSQFKTRRDEAYHTVDAYRLAFEEQLQKNKALTQRLANLTMGRHSTGVLTGKSKARIALKWLIGSLNDEGMFACSCVGWTMRLTQNFCRAITKKPTVKSVQEQKAYSEVCARTKKPTVKSMKFIFRKYEEAIKVLCSISLLKWNICRLVSCTFLILGMKNHMFFFFVGKQIVFLYIAFIWIQKVYFFHTMILLKTFISYHPNTKCGGI